MLNWYYTVISDIYYARLNKSNSLLFVKLHYWSIDHNDPRLTWVISLMENIFACCLNICGIHCIYLFI